MRTWTRDLAGKAVTRRRVLGAGLAAALAAPRAWAADSSAKAFVEAIYAHYRGSADRYPGIALDGAAVIRRYFAPGLARLMIADQDRAARAGEVGALDGDPFVDAQDWDIKDLTIALTPQGPDRAVALVRFSNLGERKALQLKLVRLAQGWRIDDIVFPGSEGTLRGLYAAAR